MKDLLLTDKERYEIWFKYEREDPLVLIDLEEMIAQAQIQKLADMGLGFYETDPNFPDNNRFIRLKDILETEGIE